MRDKTMLPTILTYDDLVRSVPGDGKEALVDVRSYDRRILAEYDKHDMKDYTGNVIFVRRSVARKLAKVNTALEKYRYTLKIVYGYRHPKVQRSYFDEWKQIMKQSRPDASSEDLDRYTHNFIAVPEVAGHPTGGAVDLTIVDQSGNPLDMGTSIADYSDEEKIRTHDAGINDVQKSNRLLLHDLMVAQDFAPFYGEWWHFSYGDREWAVFYKKKKALYGEIDWNPSTSKKAYSAGINDSAVSQSPNK